MSIDSSSGTTTFINPLTVIDINEPIILNVNVQEGTINEDYTIDNETGDIIFSTIGTYTVLYMQLTMRKILILKQLQ